MCVLYTTQQLLEIFMKLQMLEQALQPLNDYGKDEITLEVEGTVISLKPLLPIEEIECQKYAAALLADVQEESETDLLARHAALDYFDKFRTEVISYALIQINNTNLRKIEYIDTDEVLPNGVTKKVSRHVALRDIIRKNWSRAMITICFSKYGDLITLLADKAEQTVQQSMSDLESEIQRIENRLQELKEEREKRVVGDPSVTKEQITNLVDIGNSLSSHVNEQVKQQEERLQASKATSASEYVEKLEREEQTRKTIIPPVVPPPTAPLQQPSVNTPQQDISMGQQPFTTSTPEQVGKVNGVEAYKLPSQTLSTRDDNPKVNPNVPVNKDPRIASRNPNYNPRK